jgi:uncharacterized protein
VLYLDSSAFVKLYLREDELQRERVMALNNQAEETASCVIAFAEVASAFSRSFHGGHLSEEGYWEALHGFEQDWQSATQINVLPEVSSRASQLLKAHRGLRAMDALHLACALEIRAVTNLIFLTFDHQLEQVARLIMPDAFN